MTGMNLASVNSKYCPDIENELSKIAIDEIKEDMEEILEKFYELNDFENNKIIIKTVAVKIAENLSESRKTTEFFIFYSTLSIL